MPANTRRRIENLLCFLFLAVGGDIYLFYRPRILMLYVMADGLGLGSCIDCMREVAAEWPGCHGRTRTGVLNTEYAVGLRNVFLTILCPSISYPYPLLSARYIPRRIRNVPNMKKEVIRSLRIILAKTIVATGLM